MPIYTYLCPACGSFDAYNKIADREYDVCPNCGQQSAQTIGKAPAVHGFKLGFFEHISHDGVYAKSKKHLRSLCNQHGCEAPGILD